MSGKFEIEVKGSVIIAHYEGEMDSALVNDSATQIEELLDKTEANKILYDTLKMSNPPMKLALQMKSFDARIKNKVIKSATVVPGAATALKASIAFVLSKHHKVFHNDYDAAIEWLNA
ncbi:SpoIIAA family protein [Candidatus Magnetomonas plexicatena]|uniref:STAS/SEC14 domain-containing protein n=1 Tax=Candidatus Magnetomonas plexicatena TaxID=2552947 RepID=UPI001C74DCD2|nr:STAS/SEC14 domain-containing protein [Nitrospirales bacterium LBB_01]